MVTVIIVYSPFGESWITLTIDFDFIQGFTLASSDLMIWNFEPDDLSMFVLWMTESDNGKIDAFILWTERADILFLPKERASILFWEW